MNRYEKVVGYYAKRAENYDREKSRTWKSETGFRKELLEEIVKNCRETKGAIIELGVGTGRIASVLIQQFGRVVTGVDISPHMLRIAKKKAMQGGYTGKLNLIEGNMEELPFDDGVFGCGLVISAFHYVTREEETVSEFRRVLNAGARFIVGDLVVDERDSTGFFNKLERAASPAHYVYHTLKERELLFKKGGFRHISDRVFSYDKKFDDILQDKAAYFSEKQTREFMKVLGSAPADAKRVYNMDSKKMTLHYAVSAFEATRTPCL
jgi:demethylmenaquinone methyltransferase/2-methoxy-6-polyprenyl-1,4-benzoquinol methylase